MSTLLILGSKPEPVLPPPALIDAVACANASGRSALRHGLPDPVVTVMSAVLTSGHKAANDLALEALRGLRTGQLYIYPRPEVNGSALKRAWRELRRYRMHPWYFKRRLRALDYGFDEAIAWSRERYDAVMRELTGSDPDIAALMVRKQPSTGVMALAIGLADGRFDRFVMSGFSFEITHAYAHNPLIDEAGSTRSKHTETDIAILRCLADRHAGIFTTEPAVHERAGLPFLPASPARQGGRRDAAPLAAQGAS